MLAVIIDICHMMIIDLQKYLFGSAESFLVYVQSFNQRHMIRV